MAELAEPKATVLSGTEPWYNNGYSGGRKWNDADKKWGVYQNQVQGLHVEKLEAERPAEGSGQDHSESHGTGARSHVPDWAEDPSWDAGLNKGLVFRPISQKKPTKDAVGEPGWYPGGARPEYYAESNPFIPFAKAIAYAFIAIVPYLTIFDQLGANKEFVPCNNITCHYMRLFNSRHIPATGVNVMGVRNGLERPVALHYYTFDAYSCPYTNDNRSFPEKAWGPKSQACPPLGDKRYASFLDETDSLAKKVDEETDFASKYTLSVKTSFYVTKGPLIVFAWVMNLISKTNPHWGMEHIPNGICPGKTPEEMHKICVDKNKENREDKGHNIIRNHLRTMGPSKIGTMGGLFLYSTFTALHDVLLLAGVSEYYTVSFGYLATVSWGIAGVSVFFWAMGAAEVFVAPAIAGKGVEHCACFYQIPEVSALIALATPFAIFAGFMARVQMQGLAALYGDFLAYQPYFVPHYLAKQSFLWTWAVLCSPKMAGTIKGERRATTRDVNGKPVSFWWAFHYQQNTLFWLSNFLQLVLALSASAFMIAFKELSVSLYMGGEMTPMVMSVIKYVLLPGPSVVTLIVGVIAFMDVKSMTVSVDKGETFVGQLRTAGLVPCCAWNGKDPATGERSGLDYALGVATFVIFGGLIVAWTGAVAQGLSPNLSFLLGNAPLTHPKLVQAELWGACGFIFFVVHIPRVMSIAFSTWDDMETLKHLKHKHFGGAPSGVDADKRGGGAAYDKKEVTPLLTPA